MALQSTMSTTAWNTPRARSRSTARSLIAFGCVWLLAASAGLLWLARYESTPGVAASAPQRWPDASRIERVPSRPTLVMFAHPHCPCTRASIDELARLMTQVQGVAVDAYVVVLKPDGLGDEWDRTDLWRSAAAIPGVQVMDDDGGREGERFGAATSGQTLLYDAAGRLVFSGGITAARGHEGDNDGRSALVALLTTGVAAQADTAVFGCPLRDQPASCVAGTSTCLQ